MTKMKFGVVVFPGSNCDDDMVHVLQNVMHHPTEKIWHKDHTLRGFTVQDALVLPGGFSYGDYLRAGAIARFSPIMDAVKEFAAAGGLVIGICNGFQILCEAGLLPGVLLRNQNQKFISRNVFLHCENLNTRFTQAIPSGRILSMPIAHAEGRFYAPLAELNELKASGQILFTYCDGAGAVTAESNVNGSTLNIAGIMNEQGNVFGMMPHPERAAEAELGNTDGRLLFESLVQPKVAALV